MKLAVFVHPNSKKPRTEEGLSGCLHVYVSATPLEGRANRAVKEALAEYLGVAKSGVVLARGGKSRKKIFEIK